MRNSQGFTPKQQAQDLVLSWIRSLHDGRTGDFPDDSATNNFNAQVKMHLVKMHSRLLDQSGLDGTHIEPPKKHEVS